MLVAFLQEAKSSLHWRGPSSRNSLSTSTQRATTLSLCAVHAKDTSSSCILTCSDFRLRVEVADIEVVICDAIAGVDTRATDIIHDACIRCAGSIDVSGEIHKGDVGHGHQTSARESAIVATVLRDGSSKLCAHEFEVGEENVPHISPPCTSRLEGRLVRWLW